ncbi:hypothetical protein J2Y73_000327 [Peribacillus frigoritolerans]|nr:hypothetical protein [Peribacillus frigoritolerans]
MITRTSSVFIQMIRSFPVHDNDLSATVQAVL